LSLNGQVSARGHDFDQGVSSSPIPRQALIDAFRVYDYRLDISLINSIIAGRMG